MQRLARGWEPAAFEAKKCGLCMIRTEDLLFFFRDHCVFGTKSEKCNTDYK